jgi:hypothetical protein
MQVGPYIPARIQLEKAEVCWANFWANSASFSLVEVLHRLRWRKRDLEGRLDCATDRGHRNIAAGWYRRVAAQGVPNEHTQRQGVVCAFLLHRAPMRLAAMRVGRRVRATGCKRERRQVGPEDASWPPHSGENTATKG